MAPQVEKPGTDISQQKSSIKGQVCNNWCQGVRDRVMKPKVKIKGYDT